MANNRILNNPITAIFHNPLGFSSLSDLLEKKTGIIISCLLFYGELTVHKNSVITLGVVIKKLWMIEEKIEEE